MKPKHFLLLIVVSTSIFFSHCKKESVKYTGPNAAFVAKAPTVHADGGVTLNGQINSVPQNLAEYGFLVSTDSLFSYPQRFPVSSPATPGAFKLDINEGLQKNTTYYVTVYSTTGTGPLTTYNSVFFNSSGSKKLMVTSVTPLKADIGDTLTIKGKYFSNQYSFSVQFGNQYAAYQVINDSVLTCIVPTTISQQAPLITIGNSGQIDTATNKFSLNTPVIANFTSPATFRDTVVINGDHFGAGTSQVMFNSTPATIVARTRKQIKVIVPDNIPKSFTTINVTAQLQTVASGTQFQVRPPVITSVTQSGYVNDPVVITGKYFHPQGGLNVVYSENNPVQLTSGSTTQLGYNIPNGPYPRRKATVTLKLLDYTITYSPDMIIKDKWAIMGLVPFNDYGIPGAFTINNVSYAVAGSQNFNDQQQYLWKFNTTDYSWQKINIPIAFSYGKVTATANKAYLYIISGTGSNNFYEFDPSTNTWTARANYPAPLRQYGTMFAIGSKVYYGLGSSSVTMGNPDTDDSFYEYDTTTDSWRRIADYPDPQYYGLRNLASAFVINGTAYVGCGATNTGMSSFYAYSQSSGTWHRIHDFPDVRSYTTGIAYGNYGYISGGGWGTPNHDIFKYDPTADTWTHLPDYVGCNACGWGTERGYAFVNNGYVYIGGGNSSSQSYFIYGATGSGL